MHLSLNRILRQAMSYMSRQKRSVGRPRISWRSRNKQKHLILERKKEIICLHV